MALKSACVETSVAVVGAGAIGGWIASRLLRSGLRTTMLARGATLAALVSEGLVCAEAGAIHRHAVHASSEPSELGRHNWVVLAVKGQDVQAALPSAMTLLAPGGRLIAMLNGVPWWFTSGLPSWQLGPLQALDPDGCLACLAPHTSVIGAVIHASVQSPAPGQVRHVMGDGLLLGDAAEPGSAKEAEAVALFQRAGLSAAPSAHIRQDLWYKLWGNATTNPISALTRATTDQLLDDPEVLALSNRAMAELARIGEGLGCKVPHTAEERHAITRRLGAFKTSMLQDVEHGRRLELQALLGAPRELARGLGIATPALDGLHGLARLLDQSLQRARR